jgi:hypothetical protein
MIGARARLEGRPWVRKETIYQHVYAVPGKLGAAADGSRING